MGIAACPLVINPWPTIAGLSVIAVLAAMAPRRWTGKREVVAALLFAAAGIAAARHESQKARQTRDALEAFHTDRFVTIEAEVDGTWEPASGGVRMTVPSFEIEQARARGTFACPLTLYAPALPRGSGDLIRAQGFLRRPASGRWYLAVKSARLVSWIESPHPWNPRSWNRRMNLALARLATEAPEYARSVAVARALALGRKEALTEDIRDDYRTGGTYHVLVFSGLQIALAAAFVMMLLKRLRSPLIADLALLAMAFFAPLFAGFEPSVVRSAWMIGLYSLSRILERPTMRENLLFVAAIARLLAVPSEIADAGFLLTFAAAGGLVYADRLIVARSRSMALRTVAVGFGAETLTMPLTALFFHRYVLGGSLVTMMLAPLVAAMLALSALASILGLGDPFLAIPAVELLAMLDRIATRINSLVGFIPGASGEVIGPPVWSIATALTVAVVLAGLRVRHRGILALAIVTLPIAMIPLREIAASRDRPSGGMAIEALDVGQGDAILVRDPQAAVLVDGGGSPDDPAFGRRRVLPLLLERGVRHLDAVAMTHPDEDHCGGLRTLISVIPVDELWLSPRHVGSPCAKELLEIAARQLVRPRLMHDGDSRRMGSLRFEAIVARLRYKRATTNNSSVVYRVDADGRRALLAADIEKEAERTLAAEEPARIAADFLKVAHHGAANSSTVEFLETVNPRIALVSCGLSNRHGHPDPATLGRLARQSVLVWRTDRSGSLRIDALASRVRVIHNDSWRAAD